MLRTLCLIALSFAVIPAHADIYNFTFSGVESAPCLYGYCDRTGFSFDYDLTTPTSYDEYGTYYVDGVEELSIAGDGFGINFDTTDTGGLFGLSDGYGVDAGGTIATGPASHPMILPGTYTGGDAYVFGTDLFIDTDAVLTITDISSVPEPSSWVLLASGALGLVSAGVRRGKAQIL